MTVLLAATPLLGLAVGSFLNVVVHRVPRGESLVAPGSHCPVCGRPVRGRRKVPVLGWLPGGGCADCRAPIGPRSLLVVLATGLVFFALAVRMRQLHLLSALPAYLYFASVGIALAVIDLDCRRLPNVLVLPSYPVVAALLAGSAAWQGDWWALGRAAIGAGALFGFFFALALLHPQGMGFGDVKLSGILGGVLAYCSWSALVIGAFVGFLLGSVAGVAVIASRRGGRKTALPFGPFMIAGALVAIFAASRIADLYVRVLAGS